MVRKHIHMTAEIPISVDPGLIDRITTDWAASVMPKLTASVANLTVSAAEVWDFAERFVIDFSGDCSGMDVAATIDVVRAFGARHAHEEFELTTVMGEGQVRKEKVLPEGSLGIFQKSR